MIRIDGHSLNLQEILQVARFSDKVELSDRAQKNIERSHQRLVDIIKDSKPVYGLNTGFGIFADRAISVEESRRLNRNLIFSHAVGTGDPLSEEVVRAAMLIRANTLSKGFSGIRLELVQTILDMLNRGVTPQVYDQGSLGSSGDLCMLAQMALVISHDESEKENSPGLAYYQGELLPGMISMERAGINRLVLTGKDGLALINGATFSVAILALALADGIFCAQLADLAAALSFEALLGRTDALHPGIHQARGLIGQIASAAAMQTILQGSQLVNSHSQVQDAYSLRCAPQVHGAARDALNFVSQQVELEINAATDNPLIVSDGLAISGGNFHGEAVGMASDFLSIALAELAGISERRLFRLLDSHLSHGLPPMLVGEENQAGLNSGIMMLQYTAAALVLENQTLCSPDSVRSLPTSANQEDFNANAWNAARHTFLVGKNLKRVLVSEIYAACRAIDLRMARNKKVQLGTWSGKAHEWIRARIPYHAADKYWKEEVDELHSLIFSQTGFAQELAPVLTNTIKQGKD